MKSVVRYLGITVLGVALLLGSSVLLTGRFPGMPNSSSAGTAPSRLESAGESKDPHKEGLTMPGLSFFERCAFVSVDIQEERRHTMTADQLPKSWEAMGITAEDCNAGWDFFFDLALPNAVKVADACRQMGLPMIFLHWGYIFEDAMDLDPQTYQQFLKDYGPNATTWPHHISRRNSRPAKALDVRNGEYVIAKTGQDAFPSSNIEHVLRNRGVQNIVFVGGHTGGCLGKTAKHAKELGFGILCVEDATWDARESTRKKHILETSYDYVLATEEFLELADKATGQPK